MTTVKECVHHWIIESPDGRRQSPGTCRKCGAEGSSSNSPTFIFGVSRDWLAVRKLEKVEEERDGAH